MYAAAGPAVTTSLSVPAGLAHMPVGLPCMPHIFQSSSTGSTWQSMIKLNIRCSHYTSIYLRYLKYFTTHEINGSCRHFVGFCDKVNLFWGWLSIGKEQKTCLTTLDQRELKKTFSSKNNATKMYTA